MVSPAAGFTLQRRWVMDEDHIVRDVESLRHLYGEPHKAAIAKQVDYLHPHYQAFIRAAPFAILATAGQETLEVSPRGDAPGFVEIQDVHTLLLPDRRGNNRIDSLCNIVADPRVALIFLIPGVNETLRVNGTAKISVDPTLLARFEVNGKLPNTVLIVNARAVFFQCAKALMRSGLWRADRQIARTNLPSTGEILAALTDAQINAADFDCTAPETLKATLY
jgi:PPOX class probable FMN-dependent enzyme